MKFEISRELLDSTLQNVSKGLSTKTPMPVLTGVKLIAKDNQLIFITTNKEISIKMVLDQFDDLVIYSPGECVVPGKYFVDIVKKVSADKIEFTLFDTNTIKIIAKNSDFTLITFDTSNFPRPVFELDSNPITLTCKDLKQIIKQTGFACSTAENRIILTSLNFEINNNVLTVIATDSFRLAKRIATLSDDHQHLKINIPSKSLDELSKILPDSNEPINLFVSNNQALFSFNNLSFLTRLVEGNYPDVAALGRQNEVLIAKFNRQELISAVDRASLFSVTEKTNHAKFTFTSFNDAIEIASTSTEMGRVLETLDPVSLSNHVDLQLSFSSKNLLDALRAFETPTISMHFTGEIQPVTITSDENLELSQILLPVRGF